MLADLSAWLNTVLYALGFAIPSFLLMSLVMGDQRGALLITALGTSTYVVLYYALR